MNGSKQKRVIFMALALLLSVVLSSCGGGQGTVAGGGVGGTGVGPVTGFGSVIVNGVKYEDAGIDNTNFFDDNGRTKADLMAGMMVKVTATGVDDVSATGVATRIEVLRHVDGPLDNNGVDLATNRFRVMGQSVVVDTTTVFDNVVAGILIDLAAIDNLARGGRRPELEVHGVGDNTATIHATFVRMWFDNVATGRAVQVKGLVANLNPAHTVFSLGSISVNIATPPVGLSNGLFVEAKGTFRTSDNTLLATSVAIEDPSAGQSAGSLVKAEGYVKRIVTAGAQFELVGVDGLQLINWSAATAAFKDGTVADLVAGARVEVEGKRNLDRTVAATEISFRKPSTIRMDTTVTVPASPPNSLRLFGKTVFVNSLTQFKDSRDDLSTFGLASILTGDTLKVSAFLDNSTGSDRIVASRVERIDAISVDLHILQGKVNLFDTIGPTYTVLGNLITGLTVLTNVSTTSYKNADGSVMTQAEFFALLAANQGAGKSTVVKGRGTAAAPGNPMDANEVEVEPTIDN